jgi:hypothetical protein
MGCMQINKYILIVINAIIFNIYSKKEIKFKEAVNV